MPASRNDPLGFAERTRKNLAALEAVASIGADVHVVTQVTTSLLGLVAYPWEKQVAKQFKASSLQELVQRGWPAWKFLLGTFETLDDLARHLRNAIAHSFFPENRKSKPFWKGKDIFSIEGFKAFEGDVQTAIDFFFERFRKASPV